MNKFIKIVKALKLLVKQPSLINHILHADENFKQACLKKGINQLGLQSIAFTHFVKNPITVYPFNAGFGGSTPFDLALLQACTKKCANGVYFEIGTFMGESAASVAPFIKKVYTLDLSQQELIKLGLPDDYIGLKNVFSKSHNNIEHLYGNSFNFNFTPYKESIDVFFVDGDHSFAAVKNDTQKAFQSIKNKQSIIIWHDYKTHTGKVRWDVLNGILEGSNNDLHKHIYHVENTLCAIYLPDFDGEKKWLPVYYNSDKLYKVTIE